MKPLLAGIDLGGTAVKVALANTDGNVVSESSIPTLADAGPDDVLDRIGDELESLAGFEAGAIRAIGMGAPGLVDIGSGTTKFLPNLATQWRETPVARILGTRFDCPVQLLNDARAATLAELKFGHGRDQPSVTMAFFTLGTGVGGGIAVDGQLRLGPLGAAGELGHQTIVTDGILCGCGNRGCLETLASGTAIAAAGQHLLDSGTVPILKECVGDDTRVTCYHMKTAAMNGDEKVVRIFAQAGRYLGIAAANVVAVLHPDLIVLGGGVAELSQWLIPAVRQEISSRVGMFPTDTVRVVRSQLTDQAGVLGAIALAHQCDG